MILILFLLALLFIALIVCNISTDIAIKLFCLDAIKYLITIIVILTLIILIIKL